MLEKSMAAGAMDHRDPVLGQETKILVIHHVQMHPQIQFRKPTPFAQILERAGISRDEPSRIQACNTLGQWPLTVLKQSFLFLAFSYMDRGGYSFMGVEVPIDQMKEFFGNGKRGVGA